jgi:hypothetical protein
VHKLQMHERKLRVLFNVVLACGRGWGEGDRVKLAHAISPPTIQTHQRCQTARA